MKKSKVISLIILVMTLQVINVYGQVSVNGVDINKLDIEYCEIVGFNKSLLGQKMVITINYGQKLKALQNQEIKGPDGNVVNFNSMIDALNFMVKNGWEYVNDFHVDSETGPTHHYLLRRKE